MADKATQSYSKICINDALSAADGRAENEKELAVRGISKLIA